MSSAVSSKPYDPIFDSQKHFRTLLNCTARPGTIGLLEDVPMVVPPQLSGAAALVALALFSGDISFYMQDGEGVRFLRQETQAVTASAEQADFLILSGQDSSGGFDELRSAKSGTLLYPEFSATIILQVSAISPAPLADSLRLTLTGPGVETESVVFVSGVDQQFFDVLGSRNGEFPVGIDAFLTCDSLSAGPCVLALPRTTGVRWESI